MATRITPRLIELSYEAALKSFWRKEALRKFLRASHVAATFIATWAPEESKRDFLDRTFQQLQATDWGKSVIFEMAKFLSEQTTFPDLRNWEDSQQMISDAGKAVAELKEYLKTQDEEIRTEREQRKQNRKLGRRRRRFNEALPTKESFKRGLIACTRQ